MPAEVSRFGIIEHLACGTHRYSRSLGALGHVYYEPMTRAGLNRNGCFALAQRLRHIPESAVI